MLAPVAAMTARSAAGAVVPAAPSGPQVQQLSSTSLRVSWQDNSTNEDEFVIYRDGAEHDTVDPNVEEYDDTGLTEGTSYTYEVSAKNEFGESDKTSPVSGTPEDTLPDSPTNFSISIASSVENLLAATWDDNSDNEDGFRVIDEADGSVVETVSENSEAAGLDSEDGIEFATEYTMHVNAFNGAGSTSSNSDTAKTRLEPPVLTLTQESGGGSTWAQLEWTTPNGSKTSEWWIYKNGSFFDSLDGDEVPGYADTSASDGDEYYVTARGDFPESRPSNKETY